MNSKQSSRAIATILLTVIAILLEACSDTPAAITPAKPSLTPIFATETPVPVTPSQTLIPPTETATSVPPTPRSTSVPGTKFDVTTEDLKFELEVHACNMLKVSYGSFSTTGIFDDDVRSMMNFTMKIFDPAQSPITPKPGDDVMCWMKGKVLEGIVTDAQLNTWVDEGTVYLLDQAGNKSDLVYSGVIPEEQVILLLFSAPNDYVPSQIKMLDALVDLP